MVLHGLHFGDRPSSPEVDASGDLPVSTAQSGAANVSLPCDDRALACLCSVALARDTGMLRRPCGVFPWKNAQHLGLVAQLVRAHA